MVTTAKDWRFSLNNTLSSSIDQGDQYKEAFYTLKNWFVSASWTVTMSAGLGGNPSGSFTASVGDNILSKNDVVFGTIGTQTSSYFAVVPPTGWLVSGSGQEPFQLLFVPSSAAGSLNPRTIYIIAVAGVFKLNGTNPQARTPVASIGSMITCSAAQNFLAATTAIAQRWHGWCTTDGDVLFGLSDGVEMDYAFWITSFNKLSSPGEGRYRFAIYTPGAGSALGGAAIADGNNWHGVTNDGTSQFLSVNCLGWRLLSWTNGLSGVSNSTFKCPIDVYDPAASSGRYVGRIIDVSGSSYSMTSNNLVDGDTDPTRLVTLSSVWLPAPTSSLPIIF